MRVAIPIWNGRVSPVFDVAQRLVVSDADQGRLLDQKEYFVRADSLPARTQVLVDLGVEVLLCCAISNEQSQSLTGKGIRVIPHVCGPADEVVLAFLQDRLDQASLAMPGCKCRHHCHGDSPDRTAQPDAPESSRCKK